MIKEYRDLKPSEHAVKTVLKMVGKYSLYHLSKGFVPAGSCARLQEYEIWGYEFQDNNATHGKSFLTKAEMESAFASMLCREVKRHALYSLSDSLSKAHLNVSKCFELIGRHADIIGNEHFESACVKVLGSIDRAVIAGARELIRDMGVC